MIPNHPEASEWSVKLLNPYSDTLILRREWVDGERFQFQIVGVVDYWDGYKLKDREIIWRFDSAEEIEAMIEALKTAKEDLFSNPETT